MHFGFGFGFGFDFFGGVETVYIEPSFRFTVPRGEIVHQDAGIC